MVDNGLLIMVAPLAIIAIPVVIMNVQFFKTKPDKPDKARLPGTRYNRQDNLDCHTRLVYNVSIGQRDFVPGPAVQRHVGYR